MTRTLVVICVVLIALALIPRILLSDIYWRRKRRDFFPHAVRSLLLGMADGAELRIRERGSPINLRVLRSPGLGENSAEVALLLPSAEWSDPIIDKVRADLQTSGFNVLPHEDTGATEALRIRIPVPDIWDTHSGASGAMALRVALDAMGVAEDAMFILELEGEPSNRVVKRARQGEPLET